jgi:hypothetical protein
MERATTQTAAASALEPPLWLAFILRMGGELVITTAPIGSVPVYGHDAAGRLSVEMTESLEEEADWREMRVLCAVYFRKLIPTEDLSHHFLKHDTLINHPEAVGVFLPACFGSSFTDATIEA